MYGLVMIKLKEFVVTTLGREAWQEVRRLANTPHDDFQQDQPYPDEEAVALLHAIAQVAGHGDLNRCLFRFGRFVALHFIGISECLGLSNGKWRLMDYVANTPNIIQPNLILLRPDMHLPKLLTLRYTPHKALLIYRSRRRMCALARGLIQGLADELNEKVTIDERRCMQRGDQECWIFVEQPH